jgi:hypothetical protein
LVGGLEVVVVVVCPPQPDSSAATAHTRTARRRVIERRIAQSPPKSAIPTSDTSAARARAMCAGLFETCQQAMDYAVEEKRPEAQAEPERSVTSVPPGSIDP